MRSLSQAPYRELFRVARIHYVADCKLCTRENMSHIADRQGRFLTVLPRTRAESDWFRGHLQDHTLAWREVRREPNPRRQDGPDVVYEAVESPQRAQEGYRLLWYRSSQKREEDRQQREGRLRRLRAFLDTFGFDYEFASSTDYYTSGKFDATLLRGEKVAVVGVNGAGKTTLLKIMAGMDKEYSGEAWVAEGARVGYLPQEPQLDASKDVFGNVVEGMAATKALLDRFEAVSARFAEELKDGNLDTVRGDALAQVQAGADMIDVNAGIPLVDEAVLLAGMLRAVQQTVEAPVCIDSSVIEALEAGLAAYQGRALVNSVTAEDDRLQEILPLVARHDAAVIGLANDETGIPETPEKRLECARKIVAAAGDFGIAPQDVVIDPLAMTVGADTDAVTRTLATISLIRDELGVNMCLGASNVSFGLPERHVLNAGFLPMAMAAGLTSAIMSTAPVCVQAVRAADLLLGHDPWGSSWIAAYRARQAAVRETATAA